LPRLRGRRLRSVPPKRRKYCVEIACPKCGLKWLVSDTVDVDFECKCGERIVHRVSKEHAPSKQV
jgi:predicted  nucleic acid-binding Zn ribbon protein